MSAASPRHRTPATATASPVPWPGGCCPRHTGNAPRPDGGISPRRATAIHRSRHPRSRGLADRPAAGHPDQAGRRRAAQRRAQQAASSGRAASSAARQLVAHAARRIQRLAKIAARLHQEMPAASGGIDTFSASIAAGRGSPSGLRSAICGASVSRTRNRTNACGV